MACVTLLCTYIIYGVLPVRACRSGAGKKMRFFAMVREKLNFFSQNVCRYEKSNYLWGEFRCV